MNGQQVGAVLRVPIDQVRPGTNARGDIGDVTELAVSIRHIGLQKPLLVYPDDQGGYAIHDGHRRHAACVKARLTHVDVIVRARVGDRARLEQQLAMTMQTRAFDPISEAAALRELIFTHGVRHEEVARAMGKSPKWVSQRLGLLNLTGPEADAVRSGQMSLAEASVVVGRRRAAKDGRPPPAPRMAAASRPSRRAAGAGHCPTCRCEEA